MYSSKIMLSKSVNVESERFIVLNNLASPKMVIKLYFNFFFIWIFLKKIIFPVSDFLQQQYKDSKR